MRTHLDDVQAALRGETVATKGLPGPHRRLVDSVVDGGVGGPADVAALVHHVLRFEGARGGVSPHLDLPQDDYGRLRGCLEVAGLNVTRLGSGRLRSSAGRLEEPPDWLRGAVGGLDLALAAPGEVQRDGAVVATLSRQERPVAADPALEALAGTATYKSRSQAVALRTVALAPEASVLHVVLPTGSGKSLVGIAPGLLREDGTTVVVVPTVALALDQERQATRVFPNAGLPRELAYHGSLDPETKRVIRERLESGRQRLVFTSPEALVHSLSPSLHRLARSGGLRYLVLDEAHLVRTWGLDFRPEFQLVGPLASELMQIAAAAGVSPLKTVLLSATMSKEGLILNETLFPGSSSHFVGSTHVRTEMRYMVGASADEDTRRQRLVQLLRRLPRPAIVYTTRKKAAEEIADLLRDSGFSRVAAFHGDSDDTARREVLAGWSGSAGRTTVDVVVGTSAFGLGVDQSDVRAVVHACVPGGVDRYYQEVGRAGRDGHAAVAVWLPVMAKDLAEAARIEGATVIGDDKIWKRWRAMRARHLLDEETGHVVLDTSVVPEHVDVASDSNRLWNRNALALLVRAGVVDVVPVAPPTLTRGTDESDAAWAVRQEEAWTRFRNAVVVRSRLDNLDRASMEAAVGAVRSAVSQTEKEGLARVRRLLQGNECWNEVFASEYTYSESTGRCLAVQHVTPSCSGCPAHPGRGLSPAPQPVIPLPQMPKLDLPMQAALASQLHGVGALVVTYPVSGRRPGPDQWLDELIRKCVANGVRYIVVPPALRGHRALGEAHRHSGGRFVAVDTRLEGPRPFRIPTLVICGLGEAVPPAALPPVFAGGAPRVVLVPDDTEEPTRPGTLLSEWRSPVLTIEDLLRRI